MTHGLGMIMTNNDMQTHLLTVIHNMFNICLFAK